MDTDDFIAAHLCCACGGGSYAGPELNYAGEDEHCGYTLTSGADEYIMCKEGLSCQAVEDPTATETYGYVTICVNDTTNYGENAAGEWQSNSTNATGYNGTGYWFSDFTWVSGDGMMRGTWDYDSSSQQSGTWTFDEGSFVGTWVADEYNETIKHDTTPHSNQTCYDRDTVSTDALLDSNDNSC